MISQPQSPNEWIDTNGYDKWLPLSLQMWYLGRLYRLWPVKAHV